MVSTIAIYKWEAIAILAYRDLFVGVANSHKGDGRKVNQAS